VKFCECTKQIILDYPFFDYLSVFSHSLVHIIRSLLYKKGCEIFYRSTVPNYSAVEKVATVDSCIHSILVYLETTRHVQLEARTKKDFKNEDENNNLLYQTFTIITIYKTSHFSMMEQSVLLIPFDIKSLIN
jgi:hypothetical protein